MKKVLLDNTLVGISILATQIDKVIKKELESSYNTDGMTWKITLQVKNE